MRIACLTPYIPAPENTGGRIRIASLTRGFEDDELHLFTAISPDDMTWWTRNRDQLLAPFRSVTALPFVRPSGMSPRVLTLPHEVRVIDDELKESIGRAHRQRPFDVIAAHHCYAGWIALGLGPKVVVDEQNVESDYARRALRKDPWNLYANLRSYATLRRIEGHVWRKAALVTVVSEDERSAVLTRRPEAKVELVPNGIALDRHRYRAPSLRSGHELLFVGMMSYEPNVRAARVLARDVLPLVRRRVPQATLTLVGRDPAAEVRALAADDVSVTGTVDDVVPYFERAAAYAMPVSLGAGSSLKVLEPLANGLPLVASRFAVRGFPLRAGDHYLEAEDPEAIAAALVRCIEQRKQLDEMAARGFELAKSFSWRDIGRRYADAVRNAVR